MIGTFVASCTATGYSWFSLSLAYSIHGYHIIIKLNYVTKRFQKDRNDIFSAGYCKSKPVHSFNARGGSCTAIKSILEIRVSAIQFL